MTNRHAPLSGGYYSLFRILLGGYLIVHFMQLIPYGAEVFSSTGVLAAQASPLLGYLPNPLSITDSPAMVISLLLLGTASGFFIAVGFADRVAAVAAALILAWLYARNPLIANPSLPVVGWMLIAHLFVPTGVYGSLAARGHADRWAAWYFPRGIWFAAWFMLAVAYSYSGYTKLLSPSWLDGSAIATVLDNPLARDHAARQWLLALPAWMLNGMTWGVMWIELLFVPLVLFARTRWLAWTIMLIVQFGFLIFLDFADLTFPMLLIHALTFDRRWLANPSPLPSGVLFFDGWCAFCNGFIRFALAEDSHRSLRVAPLDGRLSERMAVAEQFQHQRGVDSIVFVDERGRMHRRSDAVIRVLAAIGGFWTLPAKMMRAIPRPIRDAGYDTIGRWRYRLAHRLDRSCALVPSAYSAQLRD